MSLNIFLANAPYSLKERYGYLSFLGSTQPSLSLLMIGSVLRKAGNKVRIVDASAQNLGFTEIIKQIQKNKPELVGLTAVTPAIVKTARLASVIKAINPAIPIVIGGPHFTAIPEQTLRDYPAFDYGVIGEGEETVVDLVAALSGKKDIFDVPGIAFRHNDKIMINPRREVIKDLDTLPFPAWNLLPGFPRKFFPAVFKYKRFPSSYIVSARGCPNRCIFCDTSVFGHKIRYHSSDYIIEMIAYLLKTFKIKDIIFEDDQFLIDKERVKKICLSLLKNNLKISWSCSGRVNSVDDLGLLKLMKRSGCWLINYGIESANQQLLNSAKKSITISQIEQAICFTHQAGILSKGYFIFGLPGETEETMSETIRFAKQIPLNDVSVFMLTPFPGTEIYNRLKDYHLTANDFEKMNILNVVYVPEGLTKEKLIHYQRQFIKEFYLRPSIIGNYFKRFMLNPYNLCNILRHLSFKSLLEFRE